MRRKLMASLAVLALFSCGGNNGTSNNGTNGANNGPANNGPANNGGASGEGSEYADAVSFAGGIVAANGAGLKTEGEGIRTDREGGMDTETGTRTRFETGITTSTVSEGSCVTFDWSALTATVTFDSCTFEQIGKPVSGTVVATISFMPATIALDLQSVSVGDRTVDGNVDLTFAVEGLSADASLTYDYGGTSTQVDMDVLVMVAGESALLNGTATFSAGGSTTSVELGDITWNKGVCHPTSGTADFEEADRTVTVQFLEMTPVTGEVAITLPPAPTAVVALLEPCP